MPQPNPSDPAMPRARRGSFKHAVAVVAAAFVSDSRPSMPWLRDGVQRLAARGLRWMDARRDRRDAELLGG